MPAIGPEVPQISINSGGAIIAKDPGAAKKTQIEAIRPKDYVDAKLMRYPVYDYKTGTQFFLSKAQQIVVDAYLETNNEAEALRTLNRIRKATGSTKQFGQSSVSRWLRKPQIASYIADKLIDQGKVNWFDIAKWNAWGADVMQGTRSATQVQVAVWKEYGKARGWYAEVGPQVQHNTQINFVQSDGKS